ncbi:MAG: pyruvate kinase, partial [Clostridia bacterium]
VANAVYDGSSAIMLSGETASGKYPVETVKTMASIAERTENDIDYIRRLARMEFDSRMDVTNAISHATCTTAHDLGASAIIALTYSGGTAMQLSKFRPQCPIIAPTLSVKARRQLNLSWGVIPIMSETRSNTDELFDHAVECAQTTGLVRNGDLVVITGGAPMGVAGTTNVMKVHLVGHILVSGQGMTKLNKTANVCVATDLDELRMNFTEGDILVTNEVTMAMIPVLKKASGIVSEEKGEANNAVVLAMALDIPVITGAVGATKILKSGTTITIDGSHGLVYSGTEHVL